MPIYPPRSETIKKEEQLTKRKEALQGAIRKEFTLAKIKPLIEKFRLAQISLLKAQIHLLQDKNFAKKVDNRKASTIESKMKMWESMSSQDILSIITKSI